MASEPTHHESKAKLLDAALMVIRAKGYSATTVDDVCRTAGLTKGSFFHHFESKQDLALEAARHFSSQAEGLFAAAPYRALPDPVDRLLGYVDFRKAILQGELPPVPLPARHHGAGSLRHASVDSRGLRRRHQRSRRVIGSRHCRGDAPI